MILFIHVFIGLVIALKIKSLFLACALALISHYVLDSLPHNDYSVENVKERKWKKSGREIAKIATDLIIAISLFMGACYAANVSLIHLILPVFFAILPDVLVYLDWLVPKNKLLVRHIKFHDSFHFPEKTKTSLLKKIFIQYLVILLGIGLLV